MGRARVLRGFAFGSLLACLLSGNALADEADRLSPIHPATPYEVPAGSQDPPTISAPGTTQWVRRYQGPSHDTDIATSIASSPDGSVAFVTGRSDGPSGPGGEDDTDVATIAYAIGSGAELWTARYDSFSGKRGDCGNAVAATGTQVFVTGIETGPDGFCDYAPSTSAVTAAYRAGTGKRLWVRSHDGTANAPDENHAIAARGAGVFTAGATGGKYNDPFRGRWQVVASSSRTGAQRWQWRSPDRGVAIALVVVGTRVIVTGATYRAGDTGRDFLTIAFDAASGRRIWTERFDFESESDTAWAIEASLDGKHVYVGGDGWSSERPMIVKYRTSDGEQEWAATPEPADYESLYDIAVSPDGSQVFATGNFLLGLDASDGSTLFHDRTDRQVNTGIVVNPDGSRFYVAGEYETGCTYDSDRCFYSQVTAGYKTLNGHNTFFQLGPPAQDSWSNGVIHSPVDGGSVVATGTRGSNRDYETIAVHP